MSMRIRSLAVALAIVACREGPTAPSTPIEMFDAFWATFDREYSYFAYKGINWDSLRTEFRPRATMAESEEALISILKQMVAPLRDVHVRFMPPDGGSEASYLPTATVNWNGGIWHDRMVSCGFVQPNPELGYCRMSGFGYVFVWSWNSALLTVADLDAVIDRYLDAPGLIIDVRANGGGTDALALALAGRFAQDRTTIGYVRFRNGSDHNDFGTEITRRVSPRGSFQFHKPVIVLAGRGVFSSSETFISAMRELPNVTVMGDTTGGGSGNPSQHRLKTWGYTVSRWIEWTADRRVIEWKGIPPDVVVAWDKMRVSEGRDPVIDAALARLTSVTR
jgi:hypothetical protein